jgi:predicted PurR-regulated permease PerM
MDKLEPSSKSPGWRSPFWWFRWVPTAVISVLVVYVLFEVGSVVILPILASVAFAYLLNPIVRMFERLGVSRTIAAVIAIITITIATTAFFSYVVPELWAQGSRASRTMVDSFTPENAKRQRLFLQRFSPALERVAGDKIEQFLSDPVTFYNENIAEPTAATIDAEGNLKPGRSGGSVIFSYVISSLDLLLVPFFVFYILVDFPRWRDTMEDTIPPRFRHSFSRLFDEAGRILESYVRGQLLIGLIMAVFYAIGFWFLGVPAWAGIAAIAGLLNSIPYIGTAIGILLAGAFTFANGGKAWDLAGVLGVFVAVQTLEGYVLTPRILGGRLNLHPMAVFLGLLVGGKLFGLLGMILAIPGIAIGKVFLKFGNELYHASDFYHRGDKVEGAPDADTVEERVAQAADSVLAEQKKEGEEDVAILDETSRDTVESLGLR